MPVLRDTVRLAAHFNDTANGASNSTGNGSQARQRELELKRLRGEISCAECRRLKLKCDKKLPCSSCIRRGCQTICPLGELAGGQGGRLVLADTDELHHTISEMSKRIRQLEDALQIEHGMRSSDSHPLLKDDLLTVKNGLNRDKSVTIEDGNSDEGDLIDDVSNAMGVLAISEGGGARYLGASGSEHALLSEAGVLGASMPDVLNSALDIPEQLIQASNFWPFRATYGSTHELHDLLEAQLPSRERASSLSEAFLVNMSWFCRPVAREQIMEELIPGAYKRPSTDKLRPNMDLHDLALLYMVFAAGAAADFTLPPFNPEAERYRHLARAALGLKSVFDGGSLSAVQAICLMGTYDIASGRKNSAESAWKMMCLAFSLGASIGLHRDPAKWNLGPKVVQRRRQLFWQMCWMDSWKSLSTGRPTSFTPDVIDCEFPEDLDAIVLDDGTVIPSLWDVIIRFAKSVLLGVTVRLCAARPPKYSEILEMDRQIREFNLPPIEATPEILRKVDEQSLFVRQYVLSMFRDRVLLHIHRTYFARALLENPRNPLRSPFAPSFLATYRSATSLLRLLRHFFAIYPDVFFRHWPTWAHALTASIVVGSLVMRSPNISLAPAAFSEFEQSMQLFDSEHVHPIVQQGVPILKQIYVRAKAILENVKTASTNGDASGEDSQQLTDGENGEDILKILMGSTRTTHERTVATSISSSRQVNGGSFPLDQQKATNRGSVPSMFYRPGLSMFTTSGLVPANSTSLPSPPMDDGSMNYRVTTHAAAPAPSNSQSRQEHQVVPSSASATHVEDGQSGAPFFSFDGIDFSNLEHLSLVTGLPAVPYTLQEHQASMNTVSQANDMTFYNIISDQSSDYMQGLTSLSDTAPLPIVDGSLDRAGQRVEDPWQSFVSQSGFQTADDLLRSWQVY